MKKSKVLLSSFFAIIMSLTLIVGLNINSAKAVTNTALSSVNLTMQKGASARLVKNSSGLRFTSLLSKAEYDELKANTDYTSVEFGMLIMPNEYIVKYGELNEANVFGANAKYNWKNENAEYVPVEGKTRIINLSRNIMVETSSGMAFNGAIVNILPANYAREFIGVGYIKVVTATTTEYKFATINDNARSIVFVATKALADTSITLTEPEKAILNGYINTLEVNDMSNKMSAWGGTTSTVIKNNEVRETAKSAYNIRIKADPLAVSEPTGYWNQFQVVDLGVNFNFTNKVVQFDAIRSIDANAEVRVMLLTNDDNNLVAGEVKISVSDALWGTYTLTNLTADKNIKLIRFQIMHGKAGYNADNVWVGFDNLKIIDKPIVPQNEINDLSNKLVPFAGSPVMLKQITEARADSSYNLRIQAAPKATIASPAYWEQFVSINFDTAIDFTNKMLQFDVIKSADTRGLIGVIFLDKDGNVLKDAGFLPITNSWGTINTNASLFTGAVKTIRIQILHPDSGECNANNVWVGIDNLKVVEKI